MFKKSQKVICRNDSPLGVGLSIGLKPAGIQKGVVYTVEKVSECNCGVSLVDLKESDSHYDRRCPICQNQIGARTFLSMRFEPFDYQILSNTEILSETIQERLDSPRKESNKNEIKAPWHSREQ